MIVHFTLNFFSILKIEYFSYLIVFLVIQIFLEHTFLIFPLITSKTHGDDTDSFFIPYMPRLEKPC